MVRHDTAGKRFYRKGAAQLGQPKAQVAAPRKLSAVAWWILTNRWQYRGEDEARSEGKE